MFKERLCCIKEHLRLLKYFKIIVFFRVKHMHLSPHFSSAPAMTTIKLYSGAKLLMTSEIRVSPEGCRVHTELAPSQLFTLYPGCFASMSGKG